MRDHPAFLPAMAVLLPPYAVWTVAEGEDSQKLHTLVALFCTLCFWLPGVLYALDIVFDLRIIYPSVENFLKKDS